MLFNSIEFLIFLPVVVSLYFIVTHKYRWALLLLASYYFYMCWNVKYIFLIVVSTAIGYLTAKKIWESDNQTQRKLWLIVSLGLNLGLLAYFKYSNFIGDSANNVLGLLNYDYNVPIVNVLLPIGISFYTFQILSYSIDVYRGEKIPENHLGIFALYVSFFPQLVAGPIERSKRLLPQFQKVHQFDYQRMSEGLQLICWGFFKKLVIADNIAIVVDKIYADPGNFSSITLIIATYLFAYQIYCDFSGYSDIAIGAAQVMGFNLMLNFNRPYSARSVSEFWRRWHISLTSWFKDYLYIPIGGNRVLKWRWYVNLLIVFVISGFWHGANWTFLVWGLLHGFYLIFSIVTRKQRSTLISTFQLNKYPIIMKMIQVFVAFNLIAFAWIFFRANSLPDAFCIVDKLFLHTDYTIQRGMGIYFYRWDLFLIAILILFMEFIEYLRFNSQFWQYFSLKTAWIRWPIYYFIILLTILFGEFQTREFIYFQF